MPMRPMRSWPCRANRPLVSVVAGIVAGLIMVSGCKSRFLSVTNVETYFFNHPVNFHLVVENPDRLKLAVALATAEIRRLEQFFDPINVTGSLYQFNESRTSRDVELYQILLGAQQVAAWTAGSLNIFMGYLEQVYGFHNRVPQPPGVKELEEVILALKRAAIEFEPETPEVHMPDDAYAISLTGIQEGYTADQALAYFVMAGVSKAQVRVGLQIASGESLDGLGWPIDIPGLNSEDIITRLFVENRGVATASAEDQVYTYRDMNYHIQLDPATGKPARQLHRVTVIAPTCVSAAALAKGIFIMGAEDGMNLLNQLPHIDGIIVSADGRVSMSDSLFVWMGG